MTQWIYTEYLNIYTQYLGYFATVQILLISAVSFCLIQVTEKLKHWKYEYLYVGSFVGSLINIFLIFYIYDGLRTMLLLMSDKCRKFNQQLVCDVNIQQHTGMLKFAISLAILSLLLLLAGYILQLRKK